MHLKFLIKPKWIAGHIIVIVMVAVMIWASHWQWTRLQDAKEDNAATIAATKAAPIQVTWAQQIDGFDDYRPVTASGTWDPAKTVYLRYPLLNGLQGYYVLTPLTLADGSVLTINRGWIPQADGINASLPASKSEAVTIEGVVRREERPEGAVSQTKGSPPKPTVTSFSEPQLVSLFSAKDLGPTYVELRSPAPEGSPQVLPGPEITEGSHWSYTLQWAAFAILTVVGYAILLRRARQDVIDGEREGSPAGV